MNDPAALIEALPKAELHLHIEGTLEPELIFALAERNGIELPYADLDESALALRVHDLQSFLDLYYANMAVLQTEQDFADMTRGLPGPGGARRGPARRDHAGPAGPPSRGVSLETCVNGVASVLAGSREEFGISTLLIAGFLRDLTEESALEMLEQLLAMDAPIAGIGLDSAEVGNPPAKFERLFARAKDAGLHRIAHAGEEGPPSYIIDALDLLDVERIDHGIRCMEDPELVERLVDELMPLTVCPLSNVRLRVVDTLAEHPLPAMLAAGPERLRELGRPGVFRRVRGRQLPRHAARARPVARRPAPAREGELQGVVPAGGREAAPLPGGGRAPGMTRAGRKPPPAREPLKRLEAGLPAAWYHDPAHYARELEAFWYARLDRGRREEEIPAAGDWRVVESAPSLLVVREGRRRLTAFHNTCRHRGSILCATAHGHVRAQPHRLPLPRLDLRPRRPADRHAAAHGDAGLRSGEVPAVRGGRRDLGRLRLRQSRRPNAPPLAARSASCPNASRATASRTCASASASSPT